MSFKVSRKKKKKIPTYYKTPSLCARIAFRFFLCALINFAATEATIEVASNALHNGNGIH